MGLMLDEKRYLNDLIKALNREMDKVAEILVQFMVGEIAAIPESGDITAVGKPEWRQNVIQELKWRSKLEAGGILVREVGMLNQSMPEIFQAMIVEYGMGKTSNMSNPWLQDYLSSEYYHPERGGMAVYGREGRQVFDVDSGLWQDSNAKHTNEIPHFRQEGSHFWTNIFGNSSTLAKKYFDDGIQKAIDSVDISKYLISK